MEAGGPPARSMKPQISTGSSRNRTGQPQKSAQELWREWPRDLITAGILTRGRQFRRVPKLHTAKKVAPGAMVPGARS